MPALQIIAGIEVTPGATAVAPFYCGKLVNALRSLNFLSDRNAQLMIRWYEMNKACLAMLVLGLASSACLAQAPIYRCGNEYTNTLPEGRDCKLLSGGNVTVIQGTRPSKPAVTAPASKGSSGASSSTVEQSRRDTDARLILQAELAKAQARRQEFQKEYNNGQPEMRGGESRNHQKYLDRLESLKASLSRVDGDIAGIERELSRLPAAPSGATAR